MPLLACVFTSTLFTTSLSLSKHTHTLGHSLTFYCNLSVGVWVVKDVVNFCILRSDLPLNGNGQNKKLSLTLPLKTVKNTYTHTHPPTHTHTHINTHTHTPHTLSLSLSPLLTLIFYRQREHLFIL